MNIRTYIIHPSALAVALALAALSACGGDNQLAEVMSSDLLVVGDATEVSGAGSRDTLRVESNGDWTAATQETWIHIISPRGGHGVGSQDLIFDVDASAQTTARPGTLSVSTADGISRIISVTQRPGTAVLEISPGEDAVFTYSGGEEYITVTSNVQWTATSSAQWLTINGQQELSAEGSQTVTISAAANGGSERLEGRITFRDRDNRAAAVVKRVEVGTVTPQLTVAPDTDQPIGVSVLGEVLPFGVKTNYDWQATTDLPANSSWAQLPGGGNSYTGRANSDFFTLELTVAPNTTLEARTMRLTVKTVGGSSLQEQRTVVQAAGTLPVVSELACSDTTQAGARFRFRQECSTFAATACGVRYSTSEADLSRGTAVEGTLAGADAEVSLTGLQPGTRYYVQAYATNAVGTAYGEAITFRTRSVPGRDGNETPDVTP